MHDQQIESKDFFVVLDCVPNFFSYFSIKTYVVGTQKNCLNETSRVLNKKKTFLNQNICCGYSKEPSQ